MISPILTLFDVLERLEQAGRIKASRRAHIRASVRIYAAALGCTNSEECDEAKFALEKERRNQIIERELGAEASPYLLKNTKNNISFVLRQAELLGLIAAIPDSALPSSDAESQPGKLVRRKLQRRLPSRTAAENTGFYREHYSLPVEQWNERLREQYEAWKDWTLHTKVRLPGIKPRNNAATVADKTERLETFFGYLFHVRKIVDLDFEMLFDIDYERDDLVAAKNFVELRRQPEIGLLEEFVEWHRTRHNGRVSFQARAVVSVAVNVAQKYYYLKTHLNGEFARAEDFRRLTIRLQQLNRKVTAELDEDNKQQPKPQVAETLSAGQLLAAARREFPRQSKLLKGQAGNLLALTAGRALALMFLVKHPLRSKRWREASLSENLFQDRDGNWVLHFNQIDPAKSNEFSNFGLYEKRLDAELSDHLNAYLKIWRPQLLKQSQTIPVESSRNDESIASKIGVAQSSVQPTTDFVFLNSSGRPFSSQEFSRWVEKGVYRWTGVRMNSEAIRRTVITL